MFIPSLGINGNLVSFRGWVWLVNEYFGTALAPIEQIPEGFVGLLRPVPPNLEETVQRCPSAFARVGLRESGHGDTCEIGRVRVQRVYTTIIRGRFPRVEWRATEFWEPVFALADGEVRGLISGIAPQGGMLS